MYSIVASLCHAGGRRHRFYVPGTPLRSLATLIQVYHDTVGNNGVLEMDFAIDRTGRVDSQMADAYVSPC